MVEFFQKCVNELEDASTNMRIYTHMLFFQQHLS